MALSFHVLRPGGGWAGQVPVGVDLWTDRGPVTGDRILFFDRPVPYRGAEPPSGRVSGHGREWDLVEPGLEERWEEDGVARLRQRAFIVDPWEGVAVGCYYWVEAEE